MTCSNSRDGGVGVECIDIQVSRIGGPTNSGDMGYLVHFTPYLAGAVALNFPFLDSEI